jgi:EAL domain-containing protein (putative c-di-GMP-specific phosphodiesterase class I)
LDKKVSSFILRRLNNTGNGHLVTFEIVESQEIESHIKVVNFIKKVKFLGCKIAIDDFGSGYSNFEQLLKLDIDYLKIDASLIKDIDTNRDSEIMTKSIISFAKEMGLKTIAEFVSTQSIFDKVKLLGVDYAQGYHIGKPSNLQGD